MNFREQKKQWVFVDKDAANAFKDALKQDRSIRLSGLPTVRKSLPENRGMSSPGFSVYVTGLGLMDTSGIAKLARSMRGYLWGDLDGKFAVRRPQQNPAVLTHDQKTILLRLVNAAEKKQAVSLGVRIDPKTGRQIRDTTTAAALVRKGLARKRSDGRFEATDEGFWMGDELRADERARRPSPVDLFPEIPEFGQENPSTSAENYRDVLERTADEAARFAVTAEEIAQLTPVLADLEPEYAASLRRYLAHRDIERYVAEDQEARRALEALHEQVLNASSHQIRSYKGAQQNPYISEQELAKCRGEQDTGRLQPLRRVNPMTNPDAGKTIEEANTFNTALARELKKLKKGVGATRIYQGYKGTGRQKHSRQIWVDVPWSSRGIDLWLERSSIGMGGIIAPFGKGVWIDYADKSPQEVYQEVEGFFKEWKNRGGKENPYVTDTEFAELGECRGARSWTAGPVANPIAARDWGWDGRLEKAGWKKEGNKWVKGSKEIRKSSTYHDWSMYDLDDPERGFSVPVFSQPDLPALVDRVLGVDTYGPGGSRARAVGNPPRKAEFRFSAVREAQGDWFLRPKYSVSGTMYGSNQIEYPIGASWNEAQRAAEAYDAEVEESGKLSWGYKNNPQSIHHDGPVHQTEADTTAWLRNMDVDHEEAKDLARDIRDLEVSGASHGGARHLLRFIDKAADAHGVESIFADDGKLNFDGQGYLVADYINTGDTYNATVLYDHERETFMLTTYGDWVELWEKEN